MYNTEKSYCMVCWPKRFLFKFSPNFYLQNELLQFVPIYKYLGVLISELMTDDDEIFQRMRNIYSTGNMLIRKFGKCFVNCKVLIFKTFLSQIYGCALWCSFKVSTCNKVKVSHNDIFRSLLHVPRCESASTLFTALHVHNLDNVVRASYYSLMTRLTSSTNSIVQ